MPVDAARFLTSLSRAVDLLEFEDGELEARLDDLVVTAGNVFGVAGAGMMLIDEAGQLRLIGASDQPARALELAQQQSGTGPGVQATERDHIVAVNDLRIDDRWPHLSAELVPHGIISVLSAPIRVRSRATGNLNLFDGSAHEWTQAERSAIVAFAGVAAAMLRIALEAKHGGELVSELTHQIMAADDGDRSRPTGRKSR